MRGGKLVLVASDKYYIFL